MKHFRPELYLRSQPRHDRATVEAAVAEWDRAETDYEAELKQNWGRFPAAVQSYLDSVRLHDGVLVADGPPDSDRYRLVVRSDTPDGEFVEFVYRLVEDPTVHDAGFPDDLKSDAAHWLYDEFEADPVPTQSRFTHSILFSDGRELRIPFSSLEVQRFSPLLTAIAVA